MGYKAHWRKGLVLLVVGLLMFGTALIGLADTTIVWDGEGSEDDDDCYLNRDPDGWLHWVVNQVDGGTWEDAVITLTGSGGGYTQGPTQLAGGAIHFVTPYFDIFNEDGHRILEASVFVPGGDGGKLVLSDYCPGGYEDLDVSKTAVTTYVRTHLWDIEKWVETDNGETIEVDEVEYPKIWLIGPGDEGDETATWYVDVTYEDYQDSDWNVSGTVTIENIGTLPAVIESIVDELAGTVINVGDWEDELGNSVSVTFPYTLGVGETIIGSYSEDGHVTGINEVTVTTEKDVYEADAVIVWGDPEEELNETVNIQDISCLFGTVNLGSVTAPNGYRFEYDRDFAWEDYDDECGENFTYNNTATIVETGQNSSAVLKVNILCEELTVSKTAETTFVRTHEWDIDKWVDTEYTIEVDGVIYPKIWLAMDGRGDETATWYVDVTYEGSQDSGWNVSGTVTIVNTGDVDAVIESVVDELAGTVINVGDWEDELGNPVSVTFPYTLGVGETIIGSYSEDGHVEGDNEVTVTTERDEYEADAEIIWGDPNEEFFETVNIKDISDLFGEVDLGTVTAPNGDTFDYTYDFAYEDYTDDCAGLQFNNTATIVETGQSASAILKVNIQCHFDESAWAKGDPNVPFCEYFDNWGWTNLIGPGEYEWPLWAGAAQCDTENGTLVGSVTVIYDDDGYVNVTYNVDAPYYLSETHVYAGYDMFPQQQRGRRTVSTVAPGQYYNDGPFDGSDVYVIAHAVVIIPEWPFGPFDPIE